MLLQMRRPVRPDPRPLSERTASEAGAHSVDVWLSVRRKRSHRGRPLARKFPRTARGPASSPRS